MRFERHLQRIQTEQSCTLIHRFPKEFIIEEPRTFTDPFRYVPHSSVQEAAKRIMDNIEKSQLASEFAQGKMIGVLVVKDKDSSLGYIAAFSGNVGGNSMIEGFVPPIFDLTDPEGEFKKGEAEISSINALISQLYTSEELTSLKAELADAESDRDVRISQMRSRMADSKKKREEVRKTCSDASILADLTRESQFEKAELKRLKTSCEERISHIKTRLNEFMNQIETLKHKRAAMSEKLQDWIFRQYIVHNALGESSSISDLFSGQGLIPPGGTGECAAPKLLEYAYRHGLEPLAMGELWYGCSPETAVRTHGHFYPSCTSKCGPLLGYMMKGLCIEDTDNQSVENTNNTPVIIYEDDSLIVIEKPSGMPSVPGLDGRQSLHEWLEERIGEIHAVHRLDMDTSGMMIFAKNANSAINIRRQFEEHTVRKTYMARICGDGDTNLAESGAISLPLSPDYDERPRQKVDRKDGKEAYTEYTITKQYPDGCRDILLHPFTGRTHQLRVHCAHTLGLGCPIIGDRLYGSATITENRHTRLHLHAFSITFNHPISDESITFSSKQLCYK